MQSDPILKMNSPAHLLAVTHVIAEMRVYIADPHCLQDMAKSAQYSPYHFHRMFRAVTATTPARYLAALRMDEAKKLLAKTDRSVTAISTAVGYQSLGTFTSQFTRLVGETPGRFRALIDTAAGRSIESSLGRPRRTAERSITVDLKGDLPEGKCYAATVGLFRADVPQGPLAGFGLLADDLRGALEVVPVRGLYDLFAVVLPTTADLVDLALGSTEQCQVGHTAICLRRESASLNVDVKLQPPRPYDPPIVSAAAVQHLLNAPSQAQRMRNAQHEPRYPADGGSRSSNDPCSD